VGEEGLPSELHVLRSDRMSVVPGGRLAGGLRLRRGGPPPPLPPGRHLPRPQLPPAGRPLRALGAPGRRLGRRGAQRRLARTARAR
jgi:hypothetical protein